MLAQIILFVRMWTKNKDLKIVVKYFLFILILFFTNIHFW